MGRKANAPLHSPTLRDEHLAVTRRRLVAAAREEFETTGYHAATIDGIALRAGTSRQTFYQHFANKNEIGHSVWAGLADELVPLWLAFDASHDTRTHLRGWLEEAIDFYEQRRPLFVALQEALLIDGVSDEIIEGLIDHLVRYLGDAEGAELKARRLRIRMLFVALTNICHAWNWANDDPRERALRLDVLCGMWASTLGVRG